MTSGDVPGMKKTHKCFNKSGRERIREKKKKEDQSMAISLQAYRGAGGGMEKEVQRLAMGWGGMLEKIKEKKQNTVHENL